MKRARGSTGKKGKQAAPATEELGGEEALRLKAVIESGGALSTGELLRVLKADNPCEELYSKSCKGKGGNPNCLCNLLPAPEGFRRQGLWAKEADVVGTLGHDPANNRRKDQSQPVGLKNLGNTCYVNSVLQTLFANRAFRQAVYALRQPLADEPIVKELRELFLSMQYGCTDPANPEPLAKSLNLDHAVQQDGQEFLKLFLTLLEAQFGRQEEVQGAIQALFRGQSGYLTVCQRCQRQSESSGRSDNFYEVDVPVKGFKSLQESLCSLLGVEFMGGDNQYMCEYCQCKVDATRQLQLRSLPPMLCFSLQRFVFDFQRMDRVKVSDKFGFPLTLNMAPIIDQAGREDLVYELEAIMLHKGGSATHGHYVAHIKLERPGAPSSDPAAAPDAAVPAAAAKQAGEGAGGKPQGGRKGRKKAGSAPAAAPAAAEADGAAAAGVGGGGGGDGGKGGSPVVSWWRFDDESVTELKGGPTSSTDHGGGGGAAAKAAGGGSGGGGSSAAGGRGGKGGRGGGKGGKGGRGRGGGKGGRGRGGKRAAPSSSSEDERGAAESESEADPELAAALQASMAEPGAAAAAAGMAAAAAADKGREREQAVVAAGAQQQGNGGGEGQEGGDQIVSSNAYLLVYRQRGAALPMVPLDQEQQRQLEEAEGKLAAEWQQAADSYAAAKEGLLQRQKQRQGDVRRIVEAAVQLEPGDPGRFVSSEWLSRWADGGVEADPEPVDNAPLLCPHGKLDPAKMAAARRISTPAWEQLSASWRGGPELAPGDTCPTCLSAHLDAIVAAEDTQEQRDHFLAVAAALEAGDEGRGPDLPHDYYVSQAWLSAWLKRSGRSMGTTAPTAAITCPCGNLAPEGPNKQARRVAIPADFWRFLQRSWQAACAQRRQKELQRLRKAAGGAGGGSGAGNGAWEVPPDADQKQDAQQQQQENGGEAGDGGSGEAEVICLDSPTAPAGVAAAQQQAVAAAAAKQEEDEDEVVEVEVEVEVEVKVDEEGERQQAQQANGGRRTRRGRQAAGQQQAAAQQAVSGGSDDVVMLDADEPAAPAAGEAAAAAADGSGVDGGSSGGDELVEFPVTSAAECAHCAATLAAASKALKGLQNRLAAEKGDLQHLLQPQPAALQAGGTYRLVPAAFMALWRAYMQQAGRRSVTAGGKAEVVQPPSLAESLLGVLCECHRGGGSSSWMLAYPPPAVVNKRGRWVLADADIAGPDGTPAADALASAAGGISSSGGSSGVYEVLAPNDWELLSMYYGQEEEEGGGSGRSRSRRGGGPLAGLDPQQQEQLEELLQRGIAATLVADSASNPPSALKQQQAVADGTPSAGAGAAGLEAAVAVDGTATAAGVPAQGAPKGRVAALVASAAGREESGSDSEVLAGEWTMGDADNPYRLNRRKTARQGASGTARLETQPPLCLEAVAAREAAVRAARLSYTDAQVMVEVVASAAEAAAAGEPGAAGAERKSKRARKGRAPITVSCTTTLQQLRMLVLQALDVHPLNAQLWLRGAPLEQVDDATLAECEVYPGDEIKVVDSGVHDSTDYASFLPLYEGSGKGRRPREAERGFTGTALTGLAPAAAAAPSPSDGGAAGAAAGAGEGQGIDMDAELAAAAAAGEEDGGGMEG